MRYGVLARAGAVWALLMLAEVAHGTARVLLLVPVVGDFRSRQIGVFTGSILFFALTLLLVHWMGARSRQELFAIGLFWVAATLAFELLLGHFAFGLSWGRLLEDYAIWRGGLMPVGLVVLGVAPWLASRLRAR